MFLNIDEKILKKLHLKLYPDISFDEFISSLEKKHGKTSTPEIKLSPQIAVTPSELKVMPIMDGKFAEALEKISKQLQVMANKPIIEPQDNKTLIETLNQITRLISILSKKETKVEVNLPQVSLDFDLEVTERDNLGDIKKIKIRGNNVP